MIKTIFILLLAVVVIPILAFYYGSPLSPVQKSVLWETFYMQFGIALACFIISEITRNCSQVDKLWSIKPVIYTWFVTAQFGWNPRLILMSILVSIWGARLTYNFGRRGAYSWKFWEGVEDYRWEILRQKPELSGRFKWALFNLFFISIYQNLLVWLFTMPIIFVAESTSKLNWIDGLAILGMSICIVLETVADQQQFNFQTKKYQLLNAGKELIAPYSKGFVDTGLWKYVRHPNYASEQGVWLFFYIFSVAATGNVLNWSAAGVILLLILFQSSADFSEAISAKKYPLYKNYMNEVGRFLPKFL